MNNLASLLLETPDIYDSGYNIFNVALEYYQGKTKELLKCEKYCANIVDKIGDSHDDFDIYKTPISSNDDDVRALEKELANFFKVNNVRIYWKSGGSTNAYTLPNSCITRGNAKKNLLDNKGSNMNINVFIHTETVSTTGLTGSELLAIILHEIGHNFHFCPISAFIDIISWILTVGLLPIIGLIVKGMYIISGEINDLIRRHVPTISNLIDMYNRWYMEYNLIMSPLNVITTIAALMSNPEYLAQIIANANIFKYGEEKAADSFAARYGYGEDLIMALKKMGIPKYTMYGKLAHESGAGEIVADITALQIDLIAGLTLDPHPSTDQRASALIKKLKKDLNKGNYPREVRKELEAEINRLEKVHENINVINDSSDGPNIRKGIYDMINQATDGHSDLREIFNFYFDSYQF